MLILKSLLLKTLFFKQLLQIDHELLGILCYQALWVFSIIFFTKNLEYQISIF